MKRYLRRNAPAIAGGSVFGIVLWLFRNDVSNQAGCWLILAGVVQFQCGRWAEEAAKEKDRG